MGLFLLSYLFIYTRLKTGTFQLSYYNCTKINTFQHNKIYGSLTLIIVFILTHIEGFQKFISFEL